MSDDNQMTKTIAISSIKNANQGAVQPIQAKDELHLFDQRKIKNRKIGTELLIRSNSTNMDFFKVIQKSDKYYLIPLNWNYSTSFNDEELDIGKVEVGPLKPGDYITFDQYTYMVNSNKDLTLEDCNLHLKQMREQKNSQLAAVEIEKTASVASGDSAALAKVEKDLAQYKQKMDQASSASNKYQLYIDDLHKIQTTIEQLEAKKIQIVELNPEQKLVETKKVLEVLTPKIAQLESEVQRLRSRIEKSKMAQELLKKRQEDEQQKQIEQREQELMQELEKLKSMKKKTG